MAKGNRLVEDVILVVRKFDGGVLVTVVVVAIGALTRGTGTTCFSSRIYLAYFRVLFQPFSSLYVIYSQYNLYLVYQNMAFL